mmetsp:Transcript_9664/g.15518  ORF Transcript_9664/g.15518 Transcript_9664/m.15518 type:complete len:252 (+) Transcript_9664:226-981(+)
MRPRAQEGARPVVASAARDAGSGRARRSVRPLLGFLLFAATVRAVYCEDAPVDAEGQGVSLLPPRTSPHESLPPRPPVPKSTRRSVSGHRGPTSGGGRGVSRYRASVAHAAPPTRSMPRGWHAAGYGEQRDHTRPRTCSSPAKRIRLEILRVQCTLHTLTPANACSCQAVQCLYNATHATRISCCCERGQRDTRPRTMLLSSGTVDTIAELITGKLPNSRVFVERDQKSLTIYSTPIFSQNTHTDERSSSD